MERHTKRMLPVLAALALATACTGGGNENGTAAAPPVDDDGWMDTAIVQVSMNDATGRETVTLIDEASGTSQQMSDEPLMDDVVEVEDSQ